jgi:hypothetical protein
VFGVYVVDVLYTVGSIIFGVTGVYAELFAPDAPVNVELPIVVIALTLKLYAVPTLKFEKISGDAVPLAVAPPGDAVEV